MMDMVIHEKATALDLLMLVTALAVFLGFPSKGIGLGFPFLVA
jgi:hypothetical protein